MRMIVTTGDLEEGAHHVSAEIYNKVALLIMRETHPEWSRPTQRAADGAESLEPQWICMTCKTVIGPVVDDSEHRCNCKDDYLIDLWRVAPVVESPRR